MAEYLSDAEADAGSAAAQPQQTAAPAGAATTPAAGGYLSDAQADAGTIMPLPEASARLLYKHGTFGLSPGASREKEELAEKQHPLANIVTGGGAMLGQTALLGPIAAVGKGIQGAGMLARGARGLGKAIEYTMLPNTEARTAVQTGRTASKLAGNYSALEAAGHDVTSPEKTWGETAGDVATAYGAGTALGFPLGVGAHATGRLLASGVSKVLPAFADVRAAAKNPATAGAKNLMDTAVLDKYTPEAFERLQAKLRDPNQAHKYAGLNLIEALEASELETNPVTKELSMPVKYSTNLRRAEREAAEMPGEGAHEAENAYATRRAQMSTAIQQDLDRLSGAIPGAAADVGPALDRLGAGYGRAPTHAELPAQVEKTFGAAPTDEASAEAAAEARGAQFNKRFEAMRKKPPVFTNAMQGVIDADDTLKAAVNYAAKKARIRAARETMENPDAADAMTPYTEGVRVGESDTLAGKVTEGLRTPEGQPIAEPPEGGLPEAQTGHGRGFNIWTPQAVQDINHFLYLQSQNAGDKVAQAEANQTRSFFKDWANKVFKPYAKLNKDYALHMETAEAPEHGANLGLTAGGGGKAREAEAFLTKAEKAHADAFNNHAAEQSKYEAAKAAWDADTVRLTKNNTPKKAPARTALNDAERELEARQGVLSEVRRGFGENLRDQLNSSTNKDALIERALTPAGQARILRLAGSREGNALIDSMHAMKAARLGGKTSLAPGRGEEGVQFYNQMVKEGRTGAADAYRNAYAQNLRDALANGKLNRNYLENPNALRHLEEVFGRDRSHEFVSELLTQEAARQGGKMPFNAPKTHETAQLYDQLMNARDAAGNPAPLTKQADALRKAWAQKIQSELESARTDVQGGVKGIVEKLLSQAGKERIIQMYGDTEGKKFIEALYNKHQQFGLSDRLHAGPDTAYKAERLKQKGNFWKAVSNLGTGHVLEGLRNVRDIGTDRYRQMIADQQNRLFSQQGPAAVGNVVDAILGAERMRRVTDPYARNLATRMVGPAGDELRSILEAAYGTPAPPPRRP